MTASRVRTLVAVAGLLVAVALVYFPAELVSGGRGLVGLDYYQIHLHRLRYAQAALFGPEHQLPAWYTRELLGTPFWSNIQSFPWLPTRLALLALDPLFAYAPGVLLAAALAALFTFLLCRELGLTRVSAAAAGWTFACSGFFASRTMAGHLPLLEAYPALPLLLWLVERVAGGGDRQRTALRLLPLGLGAGCVMLSGHPQLPAYAVGAAVLFAAHRCPPGLAARAVVAMGLGIGGGAFSLVPMAGLIGRSTRVLGLDRAVNDFALPAARLSAFLFPWRDGWPASVSHAGPVLDPVHEPLFWDTVCYVGWLPVLAAAALIVAGVSRESRARDPWRYFGLLGLGSLGLALPLLQSLTSRLPGTVLRSPARLLYLTEFCLAMALGLAVDRVARHPRGGTEWARIVLAMILVVHAADLAGHARRFVQTRPLTPGLYARVNPEAARLVGEGRAAIDINILIPENRSFDDVGFFDSIMLARTYRAMLDLLGDPPGLNVQSWAAGARLPVPALRAFSTGLVITSAARTDLTTRQVAPHVFLYEVERPDPRAVFFSAARTQFFPPERIHELLRSEGLRRDILRLPHPAPAGATPAPAIAAQSEPGRASYRRRGTDEIELAVRAPAAGYVRLNEAWDPGWRAWVDGRPVPVLTAEDFLIAVEVPAGDHALALVYATPLAMPGLLISALSLLALLALVRRSSSA